MNSTEHYWQQRYLKGNTGWDLGKASLPLSTYITSIKDPETKILIPGAGNAYEAEYLWNSGFRNITVLDIAKAPLKRLKNKIPELTQNQIIKQNFFRHNGQYDLILEQTFFCALDPKLRTNYLEHSFNLLKPDGRIAGVLFDFPLSESGPPFGGDLEAYKTLFSKHFVIKVLERCYNSEPSRSGKELFFIFEKNTH